jgi:uncharacterized protein YuzE
MATAVRSKKVVNACIGLSTEIMKIPMEHMWVDYDKEADVLYVSFRKPQRAKKTIEVSDDILVRKDGREIVGITILNASTKTRKER